MELKKIEKYLMCTAIILFVLLIGLVIMIYPDPYIEQATLDKQYLGNTSGCGGECINCLMIDVSEVYIKNRPGVAYPIKERATYYFSGEHELLKNLQPGDIINIKWKYIWFEGYRIRGVS